MGVDVAMVVRLPLAQALFQLGWECISEGGGCGFGWSGGLLNIAIHTEGSFSKKTPKMQATPGIKKKHDQNKSETLNWS
jgi:hypothetical protein